ncbi:hypothetical protein QBC46DRAFT_458638 [Diplogelasinospora grovesii]|uniref:SET domain-containing protein n=1 Tax=Diplogelasinospora grovesii TaxID=303347 RepID=A0AAN6N7Z3_9PEZI|nr:hypothetical protein QBC46DRAFT_458638 [Diplogelasinospora grovesii]
MCQLPTYLQVSWTPLLHLPSCPIPITESVAPNDPERWTPWTHRPHGIEADTPYCVFTNAAVPHNSSDHPDRPHRGISIATTPEIASSCLSHLIPPLTDEYIIPPQYRMNYRSLPYDVRPVPGKGLGAVATRKIEKDSVILVDHAIMLATVEYPADVLRDEVRDLLSRGAGQLADPERVLGLAQNLGDREDYDEISVVEDVLITNSFAVTVDGRDFMGLFPDLSRMNHACNPNAAIHFSETALAMTVWASRDIEPGEEITITYSDVGMTYTERQDTLHSIWGFTCSCKLCTSPPDTRRTSDERRLRIRRLRDEVIALAQKGEFKQAVEKCEEVFAVIEEEGLTTHYGGLYEIPARLYYHLGDLQSAERYTRLALQELEGYGVNSTYSVKFGGARTVLAIREMKRNLLNAPFWQRGDISSSAGQKLSQELRSYADKYQSPQVFCFNDILKADCPVDC